MTNHANRSKKNPTTSSNPKPIEISIARHKAALTQRQAAQVIHCTERGWQDWEAGKRRMHPAFFELFQIKTQGAGDDAD